MLRARAKMKEAMAKRDGDLFDTSPDNIPSVLAHEMRGRAGLSAPAKKQAELIELFKLADRPLTVDEIMVGAYRQYGRVWKRASLLSKLYRMTKGGYVKSLSGKGNKGRYARADGV